MAIAIFLGTHVLEEHAHSTVETNATVVHLLTNECVKFCIGCVVWTRKEIFLDQAEEEVFHGHDLAIKFELNVDVNVTEGKSNNLADACFTVGGSCNVVLTNCDTMPFSIPKCYPRGNLDAVERTGNLDALVQHECGVGALATKVFDIFCRNLGEVISCCDFLKCTHV